MKKAIDNFSERAHIYASFRPVYPPNLYAFLYSHLENFENAWDCGTGNGQVASQLSSRFTHVFATDISKAQLAFATTKPNISYSMSRAEKTQFLGNQFDLITVAQAIHWFDIPAFFKEAKRVLKDKGLLAIWGYNLLKINAETDAVIYDFYKNLLGDYWNKERHLVDDSYHSIQFPFKEIEVPNFEIVAEWHLEQLMGYLSSWSAVTHYQNLTGINPMDSIRPKLLELWGDKKTYIVKFPLFLRIGKLNEL
jgi:ubiquinone/menaquinone biosynthesis C-methylase UbiE